MLSTSVIADSTIIVVFALSLTFVQGQDYFQQKVDYDIRVKLDDNNHTLSAFEKIIYTNI